MSAFDAMVVIFIFFALVTLAFGLLALFRREQRAVFGLLAAMVGLFVLLTGTVLYVANNILPR
ncbi:MAG: hypothetical protein KDD73_14080 [Anaerolineales bacterium]|nr:hypothetical protein [Anaerolineales bacterium]MCB9126699.1 hypothetical protein [Ardenticatenales bacterium]MCB9171759.1 hypothetical protein [Ardenticatenales bacterium]